MSTLVGSSVRECSTCAARVSSDNAFCGACGSRMPITEPPGSDEALLGRVIDGRYRLMRKIGQGGMGAVFLAEHAGIGKRLAVKVLRADMRGKPELVRRFRREAMAVSKLTDAHSITVFDFGIWKGLVYLVMEYLPGTDLGTVLAQVGRLEAFRALFIAYQICSSLAEAHALGIVHRDLKPDNVFLMRTTGGEELVKVLDFGIAKMIGTNQDPAYQTLDGAIMGTPQFMAPEQVNGEPVDARTDLYALGALLFRMLTGHFAYSGPPMDVLVAHVSGRLPRFAEIEPDLEPMEPVEALVRWLMARKQTDRPATALQVARRISEIIEGGAPGLRAIGSAPVVEEAEAVGQEEVATISSLETVPSDPAWALASAPFDLAEVPVVEYAPPDRDEFERYERALRRRRVLRVLLLLLLLGCAATAGAFYYLKPVPNRVELEPNDEAALATRLAEAVPIVGHIGRRQDRSRSDRDIYWIEVPVRRPVATVTVTGVPGMNLIIEGHDIEGGRLFKVDDTAEGGGESVEVIAQPPRLFVVVREVWIEGTPPTENTTDAYTLEVRFEAPR